MLITCSQCDKKLKIADSNAGKKVRCPQCKALVNVPSSNAIETLPSTVAPGAAKKKKIARPSDDDVDDSNAMRCPRCDSTRVEALPANFISRLPGYVCKKCGAQLRPAGQTALCVISILFGIVLALAGLTLFIASFFTDNQRLQIASYNSVWVVVGGFAAVGLGFKQLRRPMPINVPSPPRLPIVRILVTVLVLLVVIAVGVGCLAFGFMYYLQEMM